VSLPPGTGSKIFGAVKNVFGRCAYKGCWKKSIDGSNYCEDHQPILPGWLMFIIVMTIIGVVFYFLVIK